MNASMRRRVVRLETTTRQKGAHNRSIQLSGLPDQDDGAINAFLASQGITRTDADLLIICRSMVAPVRPPRRTEWKLLSTPAFVSAAEAAELPSAIPAFRSGTAEGALHHPHLPRICESDMPIRVLEICFAARVTLRTLRRSLSHV